MKLSIQKFIGVFVVLAYLLSGVSANIKPPARGLRAPIKTDVVPTYITTVELTWDAVPGEDYAVLFYPEVAGPQCGTLECGWHCIAGPLQVGVLQYSHDSPQGVFKVWKYNYPDPLDPDENPPAEWFTPVQITGIRLISRDQIYP